MIIIITKIIPAVNCSSPPERPGAGTWEWDGSQTFHTEVTYTCGLYGNFQVSSLKTRSNKMFSIQSLQTF